MFFRPLVCFFARAKKNKRAWAYYFPEARQHVQGRPEAIRFFSPTWGIRFFRPGEKKQAHILATSSKDNCISCKSS